MCVCARMCVHFAICPVKKHKTKLIKTKPMKSNEVYYLMFCVCVCVCFVTQEVHKQKGGPKAK